MQAWRAQVPSEKVCGSLGCGCSLERQKACPWVRIQLQLHTRAKLFQVFIKDLTSRVEDIDWIMEVKKHPAPPSSFFLNILNLVV